MVSVYAEFAISEGPLFTQEWENRRNSYSESEFQDAHVLYHGGAYLRSFCRNAPFLLGMGKPSEFVFEIRILRNICSPPWRRVRNFG